MGSNILDVFLLVVIGDFNFSSTRLEINSLLLAKHLVLDGKVLKNDVINIILTVSVISSLRSLFSKITQTHSIQVRVL